MITYDEHGGFYDHVFPPDKDILPPGSNTSPTPYDRTSYGYMFDAQGRPKRQYQFAFDRLGCRVPAVLVSPWLERGHVEHRRLQHTSVLATVRRMWALRKQPLTAREGQAAAFDDLLETLAAPRSDCPTTLVRPALPAASLSAALDQPLSPAQRDVFAQITHLDGHDDFPTLMSRTYDAPEYQLDGKIFLFKNRILPNVDIGKLMIEGKSREDIQAILGGPMELELQAFYEEKGLYGNRLTAKPGTNRFGLPLTHIDYLRDPRFPERATKRLELMKAVFREMGFEIVSAGWDDPGGHHATSTCRMADNPESGVTDANLKVFGTDNLYVCSNATFPTCTAVNPTLTLTAISMRLGDHDLAHYYRFAEMIERKRLVYDPGKDRYSFSRSSSTPAR